MKSDKTAPQAVPPLWRSEIAKGLEMGEPWLRRLESDGRLVAVAAFRGLIDKYPENQDRAFYLLREDGILAGIADGMGGHDSGERSAEVGRRAFLSVDRGTLEDAIEAMNVDMRESNLAHHERGGAVFAGVHLHENGWIEVRTVGDGEVFIMSLPADLSGDLRLDYWSTRPSASQEFTYQVPVLPDGRVALGSEWRLRLDRDSNVVDSALGLRASTRDRQTVDWVETERGRLYFAIPMSDGVSEQYIRHKDLLAVVGDHIRRTGDVSPEGIRDAVLSDALIRCSLARRAYREGWPVLVTPEVFRDAYREMTLETTGVASDPPADRPPWVYEGDCFVVPGGGTAYVVRGVSAPDGGLLPDPDVVSPTTGRLILEDPAVTDHPSLVGRFKQDNLSLAVVIQRGIPSDIPRSP